MSRPRGSVTLGYNAPVLAFLREIKRGTNYPHRVKLYALALVRPYAKLQRLDLNQATELSDYLLCLIETFRWRQILITANLSTDKGRKDYQFAARMISQYTRRATRAKRINVLTDARTSRQSRSKGPMEIPPTRSDDRPFPAATRDAAS